MVARALAPSLRLALGLAPLAGAWAGAEPDGGLPGEPGGPGLALRAAKVLTAAREGPQVLHDALVLVEDGRVRAVGEADELAVPAGWTALDLGSRWLAPGFVDLHSHVGGTFDINDAVFQVNPELRVHVAVVPDDPKLRLALAGGVTTILFIPGSATNVGGQGILLKTGLDSFERMRVRDPGSLKIAQGDNPTRWGFGMGRGLMNHHIRGALRRGLAYARRWAEHEAGRGPRPELEPGLEIWRELAAKRTQVSTHTQYYQLVLQTLKILREEFGLDVYIDHGSFDSYKLAPLADELGVATILGPREIHLPRPPRFDTDGRILGTAWGFQTHGEGLLGFNTDAPVVPQEELSVQAAMGVRYGFDDRRMQALRGVTIVPAIVAGIDRRVGSIEPGKDADLVLWGGDPLDPRSAVERVWIEGRTVYDVEHKERRW